MKERFAPWLENENPVVAANSAIVLIERAKALLHGQIQRTMDGFAAEGGFRERLTRLRREQRENLQAQKADEPPPPACPACGKPMRKRIARSGPGKGKVFWGCSGYLVCKAIKEIEEESEALGRIDGDFRRRRSIPSFATLPKFAVARNGVICYS
ncbi:MAG: four helix bundle suffix domain-containing protein [Kiritimatiellae bacterium]|nr:four helix bundle suffix domain-containing protein [Kiritimatiellia bacterium]